MIYLYIFGYILMTLITYRMVRTYDRKMGSLKYRRVDVLSSLLLCLFWPILIWIVLWVSYNWRIKAWLNEETDW